MTEPAWSNLFSGAPFEFRFGARPGDPEGFFESSPEHDSRVQLRREIVAEHPERHVFQMPNSHDAVTELIRWAGLESGGCRELAQHWEQDFMVLLPEEDGQDVFVAGAICFPSSWAPEEKLGLPVHTIHDPVPTLNEQLGVRIGKFLAGIRPGKAWERVNWGLSGSPGLNQHPAVRIPPMALPLELDLMWVRREDQVLFRLPETGALIFGINVINISVAEIAADPEGRAGLRQALATMSEEIAEYKNLTVARESLVELLTR